MVLWIRKDFSMWVGVDQVNRQGGQGLPGRGIYIGKDVEAP